MRYLTALAWGGACLCAMGTGRADAAPDTPVESAELRLSRIYAEGDRTPDQPGAVSFLQQEAVETIAADHPAELLNQFPGVNVQMNSGQEHLIAIRSPVLTAGAGQGSFLVLQNGVPVRSPAFGNVNMLFEVHHEIADLVELVRGPASAKYGSNAVHGLMNFSLPDPAAPVQQKLSLSASSLERLRADAVLATADSYVGISLQHDEGWRDETGLGQQKLSAGSAFSIGPWTAHAWFSVTSLNQETAGFIEGPQAYRDADLSKSNPNPEAFRDARFAMAAIRLNRSFGDMDAVITPYARWQDMTFRLHFLPYKGLEENGHAALGVMGHLSGNSGPGQWRLGGMVDVARGDLKETQEDPFGFFPGDTRFPVGTHYDYTVDTLAAALWGEYEVTLMPDLRLLAGLRLETHDYDYTTHIPPGVSGRFRVPDNRTDQFDLITPKLGIIWDDAIGPVALYANYARGERAPQASDLYRLQDQQTVGVIRSETLDSLEIGARGAVMDERLTFDMAAYTMRKENFFFRDSQGLNVPDGKTNHTGIDLSAVFRLSDWMSVTGSLSWADHTYDFNRTADAIRSGNNVDTAPEWLGDLALDFALSDVWETRIEAEYVGDYYADAGNQVTYDGHLLVSLRTSYSLSETVEIWGRIRNVFDERYADRADVAFGAERYFPGEPVNLVLGLRKSW